MFEITTKNIVGKPDITELARLLSLKTGPYETYRLDTFSDLLEYAYIEGKAYTHGVVDVEQHAADLAAGKPKTATPRSYAYFLYADLISVDIDKPTTSEHTLDWILAQSWGRAANLIYPSSSYTPEAPRWHLVYKLDRRIYDRDEYAALAHAFYRTINLPVDDRLASPIQLSFGTIFRDPSISGKPLELTHVNEESVLSVDAIKSLPGYDEPRVFTLPETDELQEAQEYHNTEEGSYRVELHNKQTPADREKVVLDALDALLPTFGPDTSYELWSQMWMAAHHGAPTAAVRDKILTHPAVHWSDGDEGKAKFYYTWNTHSHREGGYTVASLFWLAEKRGNWLRYTAFDVPDDEWVLVDYPRMSEWAEEQEILPSRALIHSQTASGKTRNLIFMYNKLNKPKTVVFVPTMKLAAELAHTLTTNGVPASLYYNPENNRIYPADMLRSVEVLVTTLQTFVNRVYSPGVMENYGLVYVEESDQLLAQFSLAKSVFLASHVTERQAREGFEVLKEACTLSGYVYFVDATMTRITVAAAQALCPPDKQPTMIRNKYTKPKADVVFLNDRLAAYNMAIQSLVRGRKVVVAVDTKAVATELFNLVQNYGLHISNRVLLITKDTENAADVIEFMRDVNAGAKKYDMIIYNSVMASGVSVTSVRPDVIVQISEYLPPRANLQILNRFRDQAAVYVYYGQRSTLYSQTAEEIEAAAVNRLEIERKIMGLPYTPRTELAELRNHLATMAGADVYAQNRNPRAFYRRLLQEDGRYVIDRSRQIIIEGLEASLADVREYRKAQKEKIKQNWRFYRPVGPDMPPSPDMTAEDIAMGLEHYRIMKTLGDYIPMDADPEYIYDVVDHFGPVSPAISLFANQELGYIWSEEFLSDPTKPVATFHNNVTQLALFELITDFWGVELSGVYSDDEFEQRGSEFLSKLDHRRDMYGAVVRAKDEQYGYILKKYDTVSQRTAGFMRVILRMVGLKLKKIRGQWFIANLDEAKDFLNWRNHWVDDYKPDFAGALVKYNQDKIRWANEKFEQLNEADQQLVLSRWNREQTTFFAAVKSVIEDIDFHPTFS